MCWIAGPLSPPKDTLIAVSCHLPSHYFTPLTKKMGNHALLISLVPLFVLLRPCPPLQALPNSLSPCYLSHRQEAYRLEVSANTRTPEGGIRNYFFIFQSHFFYTSYTRIVKSCHIQYGTAAYLKYQRYTNSRFQQ
jgi:hypothetical protein